MKYKNIILIILLILIILTSFYFLKDKFYINFEFFENKNEFTDNTYTLDKNIILKLINQN